jgi:hypothetical protein
MGGFVLVLLLMGNAAVTIPDYPTEEACEAAGRAAFTRGLPKTPDVRATVLGHVCVPGPGFLPAE